MGSGVKRGGVKGRTRMRGEGERKGGGETERKKVEGSSGGEL